MEKKQLYIVMVVSVVLLLGVFGYRWIKGDGAEKKAKPNKAPVGAGMSAGKPTAKAQGVANAKGTAAAGKGAAISASPGGPTLRSAQPMSDVDLKVDADMPLAKVMARYHLALDRKQNKRAQAILLHATGVAKRNLELLTIGEQACEHQWQDVVKRADRLLHGALTELKLYRSYIEGVCALHAGKLPVAATRFQVALGAAKSDQLRSIVMTRQCEVSLRRKQIALAKQKCKVALDKGGDSRAMVLMARIELATDEKSEKAALLLDRALRLSPTQAPAALLLSYVYQKQGKGQLATKVLVRSGGALAAKGRHHGRLALLQRAARRASKQTAITAELARAYRAIGRDADAVVAFRLAASQAKGDVTVRIELSQLLLKTDVLSAVKVLEDAAQIDPGNKVVEGALVRARGILALKRKPRRDERRTLVEGTLMKMVFTTWGGVPRDILLKKKRYRELARGISKKGKKGKIQQVNLVRTWVPYWLPLRLDFDESSFPFPKRNGPDWQYQDWERVRWDGKAYRLLQGTQKHVVPRDGKLVFGYRWPVTYPGMAPPPVVVERYYEISPDKAYHWDMEVRVINRSARRQTIKMKLIIPTVDSEKEDRSMFNPVSLKKEAVCMVGDKVFMRTLSSIRGTEEGCMGCDASACACRRTPSKSKTFEGKVRWAGIDEMYFLIAVALNEKKDSVCRLEGSSQAKAVLASTVVFGDEVILHKGSAMVKRMTVFTGPKISEELNKVRVGGDNTKLSESIDYGLFWFLGQPMIWIMKQIQKVVGNWGLAIILLTILIKLLTMPFTVKQMRSMKGMAKLKPEMDKLKEKYGDDKQRFQQEMWALYKSHKINPLGGCLPMVLQMPIYIAWYQALMVSVDLYRAPLFGWITDLTKPDTIQLFGYGVPILPLLMGATMFLQQKMTPTTADNSQAKMMMYMMPAMFTFFMLFLPSGLTLYILTNTLLTMIHQWYMNNTD